MSISKKISLVMFGQVLNTMLSILMLPYLARALSIVDYGTYGQVLLVGEIALLVLTLGFNKVLFVQYADESLDDKNIWKTALLISSTLGIIGIMTLLFFKGRIADLMNNAGIAQLLPYYSGLILFQLLSAIVETTLIFFNKVKQYVITNVLGNIIKLILLFVAVQFFGDLQIVFILLLVAGFIQLLIGSLSLPGRFLEGGFDKAVAFGLFRMGIPIGITAALGTLYKKTDGFMISAMLDVEEYAVYRMGAIDVPFLATLSYSIATIVMPEVSKHIAKGEYRQMIALKRKAISNSMILVYPTLIFVLLFSRYIILAYLGEAYLSSAAIFFIYNLVLFIRINDYRDILISKSKNVFILYAVIISLIFNVALNYVFIKEYGNEGAAIASVISFTLLAGVLFYRTLRLTRSSFTDYFDVNKILKVTLLSLAFGGMFKFIWDLYELLWTLPLFFLVYTLVIYGLIHRFRLVQLDVILRPLEKFKPIHRLALRFFSYIRPLDHGEST